jgi:hypothetical protein
MAMFGVWVSWRLEGEGEGEEEDGEECGGKISVVRWSENLQYLAVASELRELKVYQFKSPILIENRTILRMCKQPIELFALTPKELPSTVLSIRFVSEIPFMALLIDSTDMQVL